MEAIVDEARLKGIKVACHAYDGPGLHYCIDAGVASIEHGIQLDDDAIRKMVAKGIYLVPTQSRAIYTANQDWALRSSRSSG